MKLLSASDPGRLASADPSRLHAMLRPLGLWRQRTRSVVRLAETFRDGRRPVTADDVLALPGCGRYAADSWAIFVEGRGDVEPSDRKLRWYVDKRKEGALCPA
jgi:endonuclease III